MNTLVDRKLVAFVIMNILREEGVYTPKSLEILENVKEYLEFFKLMGEVVIFDSDTFYIDLG